MIASRHPRHALIAILSGDEYRKQGRRALAPRPEARMLYIDVGNTLSGGLRTGIQRVVRALSYELAAKAPATTRLIAFDAERRTLFRPASA